MPKLEVRCCCQPEKLLGWLDVPEGMGRTTALLRKKVVFSVPRFRPSATPVSEPIQKPLELPIQKIWMHGESYYAVKAEGYTKAQLSEYYNFTPNDQPGVSE